MPKRIKFVIISVILSLLIFMSVMSYQEIFAQETSEIDANSKEIVINNVADFMRDYYVFAEIGAKMGEHIRIKHDNGDYEGFTDVKEFCRQVTADLREISDDKHIFVFYSPEEAREVAARKGLLPPEEIEKINKASFEMDRKVNFGFNRVEIMDGNIGYLKLKSFSGSNGACETAISAMGFLSSVDAIIIDLRENGGGGGGVGELLASYFFDSEKVPLSGVYLRSTGIVEQTWSLPYVPGKRLPHVDLYILTSSRTFSAAEDFCYSLKQLKRATIIGENTKGGAHPVDVLIVNGDILTQISIGNSVNPISNSNWEGIGVIPDVEVPAEEALYSAHLFALKNILKKTIDEDVKQELLFLIERLENK